MRFFFFQAEDGIRDFCLSRGLGDVYKRQQLVIKEDVNTNDKVEGDVTVIPTPEKEIPKDDSTSAAKTGDSVSIQILAGTLLISILGIGILRKKKQS